MFHYLIRYTIYIYQDHFNNFSLPEDCERGRQCKQQYFTATGCHLKQNKKCFIPVLRIQIRMDPHLKSPPGSGSAWTDAAPDPGGKKA